MPPCPKHDALSPQAISEAIAWRKELHRYPELGYHERRTAQFVASQLESWGFDVHRGLAGTGVVGTLSRGTARRSLGIRADMDALPMQEASGAPHSSERAGVMHACGHDGHVAMLLAAARACSELAHLDGTVHFIFQPAEEIEGGARRMLEEGLLEMFACDVIYALHNWPALPLGTIAVADGPVLAAIAVFEIIVSGQGCHGALPHEGSDVILAGCQLVSALQSIVSRNIDPRQAAIVSTTCFRAGDTWNVMPDQCVIRGTTRWFDPDVGNTMERRIREISEAVVQGLGCQVALRYDRRGPATVNDPTCARFVREVAAAAAVGLKIVELPPSTGAEDFALMLEKVPGCYVLLGAAREDVNPALHSPQFDFNDAALRRGAMLWVAIVERTLTAAQGPKLPTHE